MGLALCAGLLDRGRLVFAGQAMPDWPELDALAERSNHRLTTVPLDVSSESPVRAAAHQMQGLVERVDLPSKSRVAATRSAK